MSFEPNFYTEYKNHGKSFLKKRYKFDWGLDKDYKFSPSIKFNMGANYQYPDYIVLYNFYRLCYENGFDIKSRKKRPEFQRALKESGISFNFLRYKFLDIFMVFILSDFFNVEPEEFFKNEE